MTVAYDFIIVGSFTTQFRDIVDGLDSSWTDQTWFLVLGEGHHCGMCDWLESRGIEVP